MPVDPVGGLLFVRAEVARLAVSGAPTGRWDQDPSCTSGDHAMATCQLWIHDAKGNRACVVYVDGQWFLDKDFCWWG